MRLRSRSTTSLNAGDCARPPDVPAATARHNNGETE